MTSKKAADQNNVSETTHKGDTDQKRVSEYKVTGKHFKIKNEANNAVIAAHKKGFNSAVLCVRDNEFIILFGTYDTEAAAKKKVAAVKAAGLTAQIE